jgi:hypothetical protein
MMFANAGGAILGEPITRVLPGWMSINRHCLSPAPWR